MTKELPQIIILYGPAGSGKGTQSKILKEKIPSYYHLDFGTELRKFVKENLGSEDPSLQKKAERIKEQMENGQPVDTPLLRFVVEDSIVKNVKQGKGMLIEGPGRKLEEAEWLSGFFSSHNMDSVIFHLHLNLDVILERLKNRWYLPSSPTPFKSLEEAQKHAKEGEDPYQREDDVNLEAVRHRYKVMYSDVFGKILKIYMIQGGSDIVPVNADQKVEEVHRDIMDILGGKFGFSG
jgi:adenylate kinase